MTKPKDLSIIKEVEKIINVSITYTRTRDYYDTCYYTDLYGNVVEIVLSNTIGISLGKSVNKIKQLDYLKSLSLHNNNIHDITELAGLKQIKRLNISSNQIENISPIQGLKNIEVLHASNNRIKNIHTLKNLVKLKEVHVANNFIEDISVINNYTQIEHFWAYNNEIRSIPTIDKLKKVITLDLASNFINNIKNLKELTNLEELDLSNNRIQDIKPLRRLTKITKLYLSNNPISDLKLPSSENHIQLVREYLKKQEQSNLPQTAVHSKTQQLLEKTALHILQLMLLGNGEAGKTSVLRTLRTACLKIEEKEEGDIEQLPEGSTHGNIHYYWNLSKGNKKKEYLLVKDFGGQEYYHHFHPVFYHPNALYWIVTTPKAAEDAHKIAENGSFDPTYWLENVRHSLRYFHKEEDHFNAWLLLNKADKQGQEYLDTVSLNGFKKFFMLSSGVDKPKMRIPVQYQVAGERLYYALKEHIAEQQGKEEINMFSKKIFDKLNSMNEEDKQQNFSFSIKEFQKFLKEKSAVPDNIIDDYPQLIINDLRLLGICIYIEPDEEQDGLVFLFPQQLTQHIFNNILTKEVRDNKPKGEIPEENFEGNDKLKELLKHFEVVFQDGETRKWIAPQFLPNEYSDADMMAIARDGLKEKLVLKFKNYMPKGIMSRLVAYFGRNPFKKWYWRDGILFTHDFGNGRTKGMITANWDKVTTDKEKFTITIEAPNPKDLINIYKCVLLAFFNKTIERYIPYSKKDDEEEEKKEDRKHTSGTELKALILELAEGIEMSIAYNKNPSIPLSEFRKWIGALEPTFDFMPEDDTEDLQTRLVKIHDHLSYLSYLIDTKKFEGEFRPKKLFISYSHDDIETCTKIKNHIRILERQGYISTWTDAMIEPGSRWDDTIKKELQEADIVLLLLSESFLASEYIWNRELKIVDEKIKANNAIVIPVLCRHCLWHIRPVFKEYTNEKGDIRDNISSLQTLPKRPVDNRLYPIHSEAFKFPDEAYTIIANELHKLLTKKI